MEPSIMPQRWPYRNGDMDIAMAIAGTSSVDDRATALRAERRPRRAGHNDAVSDIAIYTSRYIYRDIEIIRCIGDISISRSFGAPRYFDAATMRSIRRCCHRSAIASHNDDIADTALHGFLAPMPVSRPPH